VWWKPSSPAPNEWPEEAALLGVLTVLIIMAAWAVAALLMRHTAANDRIQLDH